MKFKIIRTVHNIDFSDPTAELEELVNEALEQKWKLHGNIFTLPHYREGCIEICQAMIKDDE